MQKNSKIIIGVLVVLCLSLGVGWAYQAGYVTSTGIFSSDDELKAKESSFWGNYIERFNFDGTEFVQNIAVAVPIPEKLQYDRNYLLGTLTFKHNESKSKVIYVDTPLRVDIINEAGIFFYTKESIDNFTTRHKFHALPNVEYNIEYQINNINEFIDESGIVSFMLRNSEETLNHEVKTFFKSPLTDYDTELKVGFKFTNDDEDFYYKEIIDEKIVIQLKDRQVGEVASIDGLARIYDYGNSVGIWFLRSRSQGASIYERIYMSGETEIEINGNQVFIGDQVITLASTSIGKTIWFGGVKNTESRTFSRTGFGAGIDLHRYHYSYWNQLCTPAGYTKSNTYSRDDYDDGNWYIQSNIWKYTEGHAYTLDTVTCGIDPFENEALQILYTYIMDEPYMIDSSREIIVNNKNITEIKVDLGEVIKTIDFTIDETINGTKFTLLDEIELKELEPYELEFIVNGKPAVMPIFYDPLRKQKELWVMFDREVAKLEVSE
jgi:hypothetical protein